MYVSNQLLDFIEFVLIGNIIACIFDLFRAYRKFKEVSTRSVIIQDIIYFIIVTCMIIFSIIKLLDSQIRVYIFLGLIIGCAIYFSTISKYILKIYVLFFTTFRKILSVIFLPIILNIQVFTKIVKKMKKIWKKCCKMFLYMVSCIYEFFRKIFSFKLNKKTKEVSGL